MGVFGNVVGLIGAVVVMYLWAGNDGSRETAIRRQHAASVWMWAGVGCAIDWIVGVLGLLILLSAFPR